MQNLKLDIKLFINEYWQKKPGIFRNVFQDTNDIIDEHELAGLAQEEELDSRIISNNNGQWQHDAGPFEDFAPFCYGQWSLLVQGVENLLPQAQELLNEFCFIPSWRIDDLMMSFSVPGAGVGPHIDQYDVFIIQGKGNRRWQIGPPGRYKSINPHPRICQIESFETVIDEILSPGDMIYIPPGHPHNGIALEDCINYSVGFRAATQTELLSHFCDHLIDNDLGTTRLTDPLLQLRNSAGELKQQEIEKFRQHLRNIIDGEHFENWLGSRLTDTEKFIPEYPEQPLNYDETMHLVNSGQTFYKAPGLRYLHYEISSDAQQVNVFINGNRYFFPISDQKKVIKLLNEAVWRNESKKTFKNCSQFIHNLSTLVNAGFWTV